MIKVKRGNEYLYWSIADLLDYAKDHGIEVFMNNGKLKYKELCAGDLYTYDEIKGVFLAHNKVSIVKQDINYVNLPTPNVKKN